MGLEQIYSHYSETLQEDSGRIFLDHMKDFVRECGPVFPMQEASLQLLENEEVVKLVDKLVSVELEGKYKPFSHAIGMVWYVTDTARKINSVCKRALNTFMIDEPLLATAAFLHDIGNVISEVEIDRLGLGENDLSDYTKSYPDPRPADKINGKSSHILKTIAFMIALGFPEHANTAAHSAYHLNLFDHAEDRFKKLIIPAGDESILIANGEADKEKNVITLERVILMLADESMVDKTGSDDGWFGVRMSDVIHKADISFAKYGQPEQFRLSLEQVALLKTVQSLISDMGIDLPGKKSDVNSAELDNLELNYRLSAFINFLGAFFIKRTNIIPAVNSE